MQIIIDCGCGKRLAIDDAASGATLKCPACGRALTVGAKGGPAAPAPLSAPNTAPLSAPPTAPLTPAPTAPLTPSTTAPLSAATSAHLSAPTMAPLQADSQNNQKKLVIGGGVAVLILVVAGAVALLRSSPDDEAADESPAETPAVVDAAPPRPAPPAAAPRQALPAPRPAPQPVLPPPVTTPPVVAPAAGEFAVGRSGQWEGRIEYVWGRFGPPSEIHFRVQLTAAAGVAREVDAFVLDQAPQWDLTMAHQVLDYLTVQEAKERGGGGAADRVRLTGVVADTSQVRFRVTDASAPLIQLTALERPGDAGSRVTVGEPRQAASRDSAAADDALRAILRVPPPAGPDLTFRGRYRHYEGESETIVVALGTEADRGAEVHFPGTDFGHFRPGDDVEVLATPTGLVYQRVVDNTLIKRPFLVGKTVRRPEISEEVIRNDGAAVAAVPTGGGSSPRLPSPGGTDGVPPPRPATPLNQKRLGPDLLVVSEEGQAAILSGDRWYSLRPSPQTPSKIMWTFVDSRGACWLSGVGGVTRVQGEQVDFFTTSDGLPDKPLAHVLEDSQGRIWVGSWGAGVAVFERDRWRVLSTPDGLRHPDVNGCVEDNRGRIWVAGSAGMAQGGRGVTLFGKDGFESGGIGEQLTVNVMSLDGDAEGRVYLGYIGGLLIVHPDLTFVNVTPQQGLPQKTPQATYVDSRGRIWAGTWGGGVAQISSRNYQVLDDMKLPAAGQVRRITEDSQGTIWVGSLQGLWRSNGNRWEKVTTPREIPQVMVVASLPRPVSERLLNRKFAAGSGATRNGEATPPPGLAAGQPDAGAPGQPANPGTRPANQGDAADYLGEDGNLKSSLVLEDGWEVPLVDDQGQRLFTIFIYQSLNVDRTGHWSHNWKVTGAANSGYETKQGSDQGQFTQREMAALGKTLAQHDLLHLPRRVKLERQTVGQAGTLVRSVRVRYRTNLYQATFPEGREQEAGRTEAANPVLERYRGLAQVLRLVGGGDIDDELAKGMSGNQD